MQHSDKMTDAVKLKQHVINTITVGSTLPPHPCKGGGEIFPTPKNCRLSHDMGLRSSMFVKLHQDIFAIFTFTVMSLFLLTSAFL